MTKTANVVKNVSPVQVKNSVSVFSDRDKKNREKNYRDRDRDAKQTFAYKASTYGVLFSILTFQKLIAQKL